MVIVRFFEQLNLYANCQRQRSVEYVRSENHNESELEKNSVIFDGMGTYFELRKDDFK